MLKHEVDNSGLAVAPFSQEITLYIKVYIFIICFMLHEQSSMLVII